MNVLLRAVCAATLVAATVIATGCGENFRQVARPEPVPGGNPAGTETQVVLNQCPIGVTCLDVSGTPTGSVVTAIDVAGDTNMGNKPLQNQVGSVAGPVTGSMGAPIAFDGARTAVFTANTSTDSVTKLLLSTSTAGFAANATTITLPAGAAPIAISFEYFGLTYTQDYVVNSGATANCPGTGSLGVISQTTTPATLRAVVCLPPIAPAVSAHPVAAWIYTPDRSKVFVLDDQPSGNGNVYVVNAANAQVTNHFAVGSQPFKVAQSNDGLFLYVLNGDHTISVIDAQAEAVVGTVSTDNPGSTDTPVDIAQITNFNDTSANTQVNHVWVLHADGVVSVFDGTAVSALNTLTWITSVDTGGTPTNLALLRDGTWAYVGLAGTNQVVGIDTSQLARGVVTVGATTPITIPGRLVTRTVTNQLGNPVVETLETTTRTVTSVAVSRQGSSSQLSKLYATTVTSTTYNYYDQFGALQSSATDPNLFNGTAIISAADISGGAPGLNTPINTVITILAAPSQVATCDPGNPAAAYDIQKNCPAMLPVLALGRS